jgi:CheY-like chemotaxis protein
MQEPGAVLVVEDEALIRADTVELIDQAGFPVVEAENAAEALDLLGTRSDIAAVFTDVRMPGPLDGVALARIVHDRWPRIMLIVTSGHVHLGPRELPAGAAFLPKPYRGSDIIATLRRTLG